MCLAAIGRVVEVRTERGALLAEVVFDGKTMTVGVPFTPNVEPGMFVVVHAGLALEVLDSETAAEALSLRAQLEAPDVPTDP